METHTEARTIRAPRDVAHLVFGFSRPAWAKIVFYWYSKARGGVFSLRAADAAGLIGISEKYYQDSAPKIVEELRVARPALDYRRGVIVGLSLNYREGYIQFPCPPESLTGLAPHLFVTLMCISANYGLADDGCYVRTDKLASDMGVTPRGLQKRVRELVSFGLLAVTDRLPRVGQRGTTVHKFLVPDAVRAWSKNQVLLKKLSSSGNPDPSSDEHPATVRMETEPQFACSDEDLAPKPLKLPDESRGEVPGNNLKEESLQDSPTEITPSTNAAAPQERMDLATAAQQARDRLRTNHQRVYTGGIMQMVDEWESAGKSLNSVTPSVVLGIYLREYESAKGHPLRTNKNLNLAIAAISDLLELEDVRSVLHTAEWVSRDGANYRRKLAPEFVFGDCFEDAFDAASRAADTYKRRTDAQKFSEMAKARNKEKAAGSKPRLGYGARYTDGRS